MTLSGTRNPLRAFPVAIALIFNVILGPLAPLTGTFAPGQVAQATHGGVHITPDPDLNGCMGVVTTPGSENTSKTFVSGSFQPGGTATFQIEYPVDPDDVGQETFRITDCVFIDDDPSDNQPGTAVAKYFIDFVPNEEAFVLTFTLTIPADAPVGDEYCNYAKTTASPSDSQASNRKANPSCFLIGGDLRVNKTNQAGAPLAGATFAISCVFPVTTSALTNTVINVPTNGTATDGIDAGTDMNATEAYVSRSGETLNITATTGDQGFIALEVPSGTSCRFTETAPPAGYIDEDPDPTVVLVANPDAAQTYTFVNRAAPGKLEVVKDLNPSGDLGRFDLQIDGTTRADEAGDGGTTGEVTVSAGSHTVGEVADGETSLSNYTSSIECRGSNGTGAVIASSSNAGPLSVAVASNADVVCVITNTRQTGRLEVVKDLTPSDDPGRFDLQIDGTTRADEAGDGGTTGEVTVNTGTHTVGEVADGETSLANYTSSISCRADNGTGAVVASGSNAGPLNVSVTSGSDIVCTISNTRQTGRLEVVKDLNPSDDPGRFDLQIDGTTRADEAGDGGTTGEVTLNTGTHTVGEIADGETSLGNYTSSISCRADNGTGAVVASSSTAGPLNVNVTSGSDIVCTITNTRQTGTLTVVKDLNPSGDLGRFDLQIDGTTRADEAGDGGTTGAVTVNTGTHTVGETADGETSLANYTSSIRCLNGTTEVASSSNAGPLTVSVSNGANIVCTITNTRQTGRLEVIKDLNPSGDPGRFDLQIDGTTRADEAGDGGTTGEVTLNTGNHTVGEIADGETSLGNYSSSIVCRLENGLGATIASGSGAGPLAVNVTNNSDIVCTITNTRVTVGFSKANDEGDNASVEPGETIRYTLTVTVSNGPATGVVVTDELPDGLTYVTGSAVPSAGFSVSGQDLTWTVAGELAPGTYTFRYDARVDDDARGSLTNLGCVDVDQNPALVCDETTVNVQRITVIKTNGTTGPVVPGTAVDFTLTLDVTNGPIDDITIVDQLPAGIGNVTNISDGGTYNSTTNRITWILENVADNETLTYRATVSATATAGTYTNVATITEGPCVEDCDDDSIVVVRVPALVVDKAASTETVRLLFNAQGGLISATPSTVTWTITWTLSSGPVTNAVITDVIPDGLTYVAGSASNGGAYNPANRTLTWTLGTLTAGSGTVTFQTTTDADAAIGTPIENVAVIDSNETAPDDGRDSITVTEQQELGSTGTPRPSVPNTASVNGPNGQPVTIPIELLAILFLASLGTLATANVRSVRRRR